MAKKIKGVLAGKDVFKPHADHVRYLIRSLDKVGKGKGTPVMTSCLNAAYALNEWLESVGEEPVDR